MLRRQVYLWGFCLIWIFLGCQDEHTSGEGDGPKDTDSSVGADDDIWEPRFNAFAAALKGDMRTNKAFGISAAIMEDGEVTFAAAFGYKDEDQTNPLRTTTLMQIGSTSKQMTAVALLRSVADGGVSLDASLEDALPGFEFALDDTWNDSITVHDLLSQQSGIVDWTPWVGSPDDDQLSAYTYGEFAEQAYAMNPPGIFFNYANPNYVLSGLLAENADTRAFPDILTQDLFVPLGMDRTFLRKTAVEADGDYALSFGFGNGLSADSNMQAIPMAEVQDSAWVRPAGLVWTTPTQMMQWADFMMHGDEALLADASLDKMETGYQEVYPEVPFSHYGYGLFVDEGFIAGNGLFYQTPIWQHGGNTLSFSHEFYMLPDHDVSFSICISVYGADLSRSVLAALTTFLDLQNGIVPPVPEPDPNVFDRHVGEYFDPWLVGRMIISREGDTLLVDLPDLTAEGLTVEPELVAITSRLFVLTVEGESFDLGFYPETPDGPSIYVRNRVMVATRVKEEDSASQKRVLVAPPVVSAFKRHRLMPRLPLWLRNLVRAERR